MKLFSRPAFSYKILAQLLQKCQHINFPKAKEFLEAFESLLIFSPTTHNFDKVFEFSLRITVRIQKTCNQLSYENCFRNKKNRLINHEII